MREIEGGENLPLGLCDTSIESRPFNLEAGEWLIGYTDGLSEMRNDRDEMIGMQRLHEEFVRRCAFPSASSADQLADQINTCLDSYPGRAAIADDRTLIIARRLDHHDSR